MLKKILYGILLFAVGVITFFIYEEIQFTNYLSSQAGNEMNIPVNKNAPVLSQGQIEIAAPVEKVWQVLTTINEWPSWQSEVTEAHLNGELGEGTTFDWKAGGLSFASKIHTVKLNIGFGWTGETLGASAVHNWFFREAEGKTIIRVEESLQGVFPRLFKNYFQKNLDKGVQKNLEDLKAASEK